MAIGLLYQLTFLCHTHPEIFQFADTWHLEAPSCRLQGCSIESRRLNRRSVLCVPTFKVGACSSINTAVSSFTLDQCPGVSRRIAAIHFLEVCVLPQVRSWIFSIVASERQTTIVGILEVGVAGSTILTRCAWCSLLTILDVWH